MAKTATKIHHHVFAGILAVGIALFFGLIVYPKIAFEQGELGTPAAPENFQVSEIVGQAGTMTWEEPRDTGDFAIDGYNVYYGLDSGRLDVVEGGVTRTSYEFSGLTPGAEYFFAVSAVNATGEGVSSDQISVRADARGGIEISGAPAVVATDTGATITWTTSAEGSSIVYYGPIETVSGITPEYNTLSRVTGHSVELTGLVSCTKYWFKVASNDASSNNVESVGGEFETSGCKGNSDILVINTGRATTDTGVTVDAKVSGRGIEVVAPAALKTGIAEFAITAMKLEQANVSTAISAPSGKNWAGDNAFSLKALEDEVTEFDDTFDQAVEVTIDYTSADVVGLDVDTLKIHHYTDGIGWEELSDCSVDAVAMQVTCSTTSFSIFGLFGEQQSSGSSSGSRPSAPVTEVTTPSEQVVVVAPVVTEVSMEDDKPSVATVIAKDLGYGLIDVDVKILQKSLNDLGFKLATDGAGAPGQETEYFGPRTKAALIRFQETYRSEILTPLGLVNGTGFFGEKTRAKFNALMSI